LLGYSKEEFPNDMYQIMDLVHPDDYEETMEAMRKHLRGEDKTYNTEYRIKGKDNKTRLIKASFFYKFILS
jgi:two-component system CheB/CheR fusion protein